MIKQHFKSGKRRRQLATVLQISKSGFYAAKQSSALGKLAARDQLAIERLKKYQELYPRNGLRPAAYDLGYAINTIRRLRAIGGLKGPQRRKKRQSWSAKKELQAPENILIRYKKKEGGYPQAVLKDQKIWSGDITTMGGLYLAVIVDVGSRLIVGWELATHQKTSPVFSALEMALRHYRPPRVMHSDQGAVYLSQELLKLLQRFNIQISCSAPGKPIENPFSERLMLTVKDELGSITSLKFGEVYELLAGSIYHYNHNRRHCALKMMTPFEYYWQINKPVADHLPDLISLDQSRLPLHV